MKQSRIGWLLVVAGVLLVMAWGFGLARTGLSLRRHLVATESLARSPSTADPLAACSLARGLRADVASLRGDAGWLAQAASLLGWLPRVGGDLRAAPHMLEMADGLTEAGAALCAALPAGGSLAPASAGKAALLQTAFLMLGDQRSVEQARDGVARAQAAWEEVDRASLSGPLADRAGLLEQGLRLAGAGLELAPNLPDLLGFNGPRTYLLLALNEDELRPGGGFISGVGEVRLEAGQVADISFRDSYDADDFRLPYPDPPAPMRRYLGIDLWVFRDSNWSPDFPTAARQAIALYRPGRPVDVSGVVALDQAALRGLLTALGPIRLAGAPEPVTGDNVIAYIRRSWAPADGRLTGAWWEQRKSFMGPLAEAALQRLQSGQVNWQALLQAATALLDQKHAQAYVAEPQAQAVLVRLGWAGALVSRPGDFLMVVDANVGYNKANARVNRAMAYEVDLRGGVPQATLAITYTHTTMAPAACRPEVRYDPIYDRMMERCYWDYARVYVPSGSQLQAATHVPVPGEQVFGGQPDSGEVSIEPAPEGPWLVYGSFSVLPPMSTQTHRYTYTLPSGVISWEGAEATYSLTLQAQAGTAAPPLIARYLLPDDAVLLEAGPLPTRVSSGQVLFDLRLDHDQALTLRWRKR